MTERDAPPPSRISNPWTAVAGALTLVVVLAAGCGDNSRSCGEGTNDLDGDGECEPNAGGNTVCGDGTRLDPVTEDCVVDPDSCGGGTVLVNGRCQDPTAALDIDLEEGPEPNAFEPGAVPAGLVTLEPVGSDGFVIHGCIQPIDDATPDLDVYLLTVAAPTLIGVTADGVQGLAAGFQITSTEAPLATWRRFGISVATDMSRRQVWLPAAGAYRLVVTDSRTLQPEVDGAGGAVSPPAGNPDGTSCYYVTIDQQTPAPVALDTTNGDAGTITSDLGFYNVTGVAGNLRLTATITTPHAQPSLVVMKNDMLFAFDDDGSMMFDASGSPLVVFDFVHNYSLFPSPYQLTVQ